MGFGRGIFGILRLACYGVSERNRGPGTKEKEIEFERYRNRKTTGFFR